MASGTNYYDQYLPQAEAGGQGGAGNGSTSVVRQAASALTSGSASLAVGPWATGVTALVYAVAMTAAVLLIIIMIDPDQPDWVLGDDGFAVIIGGISAAFTFIGFAHLAWNVLSGSWRKPGQGASAQQMS